MGCLPEIEIREEKERRGITVWVSPDDKEIYDLLKETYKVKMQQEVKKVVIKKIQELKAQFLGRKQAG